MIKNVNKHKTRESTGIRDQGYGQIAMALNDAGDVTGPALSFLLLVLLAFRAVL